MADSTAFEDSHARRSEPLAVASVPAVDNTHPDPAASAEEAAIAAAAEGGPGAARNKLDRLPSARLRRAYVAALARQSNTFVQRVLAPPPSPPTNSAPAPPRSEPQSASGAASTASAPATPTKAPVGAPPPLPKPPDPPQVPAAPTPAAAAVPPPPPISAPSPSLATPPGPPVDVSAQALPHQPQLASAAVDVRRLADTHKAALVTATRALQAALKADVDARQGTVTSSVAARVASVTAALDARKAQVGQAFETARSTIQADVDAQVAAARADGTGSIQALRKEVEDRRKDALDSSTGLATEIEQSGAAEADRLSASSVATTSSIRATAQAHAAGFQGDPDKRPKVQQALMQAAADAGSKVQKNSQEAAQASREAAAQAAHQFRKRGTDLAADIGSSADLEARILHAVDATVAQIQALGKQHIQALDPARTQALEQLDKVHSEAVDGLRKLGQAMQSALGQASHAAIVQTTVNRTRTLQQFDQMTVQVIGQLRDADTGQPVNQATLARTVQQIDAALQQGRLDLTGALTDQATAVREQLDELHGNFDTSTNQVGQRAESASDNLLGKASAGFGRAHSEAALGTSQAVNAGRSTTQQSLQEFISGLQQKVGEVKQTWLQDRDRFQAQLKGNSDKAIQNNTDAQQHAPAHFNSVANAVSGSFSFDWLGALKAVGEFIVGAIVATVLVGIIMAVLGVSLPVALAILLVAFVIIALDKRIDEAAKELPPNPSWLDYFLLGLGAFSAAVLDVLGIAGIYEGFTDKSILTGKKLNQTDEQRTERVVLGFLTVIGFIIGAARAARGAPVPEPEPVPEPRPGPEPGPKPGPEPKPEPKPEPEPEPTGGKVVGGDEIEPPDPKLDLDETPTPEELEEAKALCFGAGTLVSTPSGLRAIESLAPGDRVYAYDFEAQGRVIERIEGVSSGRTRTWIDIEIGSTVLRATGNHPVWSESAGDWASARELKAGDLLRTDHDGGQAAIAHVSVRTVAEPEPTFNLHLAATHTYFVGAAAVLVHNGTLTRADLARLNRTGFRNYTLRFGPRSPEVLAGTGRVGQIYYSGMFGPNVSEAQVRARHAANNDRFVEGVDEFVPEPGARTYGDARILEHDIAVENDTIIGRDPKTFRGNRQDPINAKRLPLYRKFQEGCG